MTPEQEDKVVNEIANRHGFVDTYTLAGKTYFDIDAGVAACIREAITSTRKQTLEWIPVSTRLPEDGKSKLVRTAYNEGTPWPRTDLGHYVNQWYIQGAISSDRIITHWMELPEPPISSPAATDSINADELSRKGSQ